MKNRLPIQFLHSTAITMISSPLSNLKTADSSAPTQHLTSWFTCSAISALQKCVFQVILDPGLLLLQDNLSHSTHPVLSPPECGFYIY